MMPPSGLGAVSQSAATRSRRPRAPPADSEYEPPTSPPPAKPISRIPAAVVRFSSAPEDNIRFQRLTLQGASGWLSSRLSSIDQMAKDMAATNTDYVFSLSTKPSSHGKFELYCSRNVDGKKLISSGPNLFPSSGESASTGSEDNNDAQLHRAAAEESHRRLFAIIANVTPDFGTDLATVLVNVEQVVELAILYDCLERVRPYLNSEFFSHLGEIYNAIAADPPRWLNLSLRLEAQGVFKEALIHCAGGFPAYNKWPTPIDKTSPPLRAIVLHKAMVLKTWSDQIYLELFKLEFEWVTGEPGDLGCPESIRAVSVFQEWLAGRLRIVTPDRGAKYQDATLFRDILAGGDAYLPPQDVAARLEKIRGKAIKDQVRVQELLTKVKEFAKVLVRPLAKNCLVIDSVHHSLPYLTCTQVTGEDFPWLKPQAGPPKEQSRAASGAAMTPINVD